MERTFKSFVIYVLVAILVFSGTLVLASAHKEDVEQKSINLGPFLGFSVRTKEATSVSVSYAGILPLEKTVKVQTVIDLTETIKKFGCPPVIPMKPEEPKPAFPPEKPFSFDVFTIAIDSKGNLKQYHIWTLKLTESWFYPMEQTEW